MSLNEMEEGMKNRLCPTDCRWENCFRMHTEIFFITEADLLIVFWHCCSRLRPDIRKLEEGDIDGAAAEKTRLEEKQRDARKARKGKKGLDWAPRYISVSMLCDENTCRRLWPFVYLHVSSPLLNKYWWKLVSCNLNIVSSDVISLPTESPTWRTRVFVFRLAPTSPLLWQGKLAA